MLNFLKSNPFKLIFGIILTGLFLPTVIGDTNNRLVIIPTVIGLILIGYSLSKFDNS